MNKPKNLFLNATELREGAEKKLAAKTESITEQEIDYKQLVHELQVHQVELEMQNEALAAALLTEQTRRVSNAALHSALTQLKDAESITLSIMDSLESSIAVLNEWGDIIQTNQAWRSFAAENGGQHLIQGEIPLNYFAVLRNARDLPEAASILSGIQAVLNGRQARFTFEYPCDTPNQQRWFRLEVLPLKGSITGLVTHHIDITERKMMEDTLRRHERLLADSQAVNHIGSWLLDIKSGMVSWSEECFRLYGLTPEKDATLSLQYFLDAVHPDDRVALQSWCEDCMAGKCPPGQEFRTNEINGAVRWLFGRGQLETTANGKPLRMLGTVEDITQRKIITDALRDSEARLRAFLDNSATVAWLKDAKGQYVYISPTYEQRFNFHLDDIRGKTDFEIWLLEMAEQYYANDQLVLKKNQRIEMIETAKNPDGSLSWWFSCKFPFQDAQGNRFIGGLGVDITEQKQAEAALLESKTKYQDLANHLELVREEEKVRIAHEIHDDLGNFLTVLKVDMSWLDKQLPVNLPKCREKSQEILQEINACIQAVRNLITDLRPSILDNLGLFAAIEWKVENFRRRTGINCQLTLPEQPLIINIIHSTVIYRILQEALTNILSHANATLLTIVVELSQNDIFMTITDNGCGISPTDKIKPAGFGLQSIQERARYFGGTLNISSLPGSGTTLSLSMPLTTIE